MMQGMQLLPATTAPSTRNAPAQKSTPESPKPNSFESKLKQSELSESLPTEDVEISKNDKKENDQIVDPDQAPEIVSETPLTPVAIPAPVIFQTPAVVTPVIPVTCENSSDPEEKNSDTPATSEASIKKTETPLIPSASSEILSFQSSPLNKGALPAEMDPSNHPPAANYINLSATEALGTDHAGERVTVTEEMIHQAGPQFWQLSGGTWDSNVSPLKHATQNAPGESLQLSSTHRLQDVVDSVFEERPLPTPRRIEIELKTPEGAKISLYLARVQGELRAQFSANSTQAFSWLQQEIRQLRGIDLGQTIRWLPPQIESSTRPVEKSGKSKDSEFSSESDNQKDRGLDDLFEIFKTPARRLA